MRFTYSILKMYTSICLLGLLVACAPLTGIDTATPPRETSTIAVTNTALTVPSPIVSSTSVSQVGCALPPTGVSRSKIRWFYWSEDSEFIFFKEKGGQIWYRYNIVTGETTKDFTPAPATPTAAFEQFEIQNVQETFISPSGEIVIFTRKVAGWYDVYYKHLAAEQEQYLGKIYGSISNVDWVSDETSAILAMDWQAPIVQDAYVYLIRFAESILSIEMSVPGLYKNVEYLGLTPDNTRFMFVSYNGNPVVRLWNIATDEVSNTPMFNPMSFQWVSENEIISVNPNRDKLFWVDVLLFNIYTRETIYLADGLFFIDPFIQNGLISPDGKSIAYVENETDNLFWTRCID